MNFFNAPRLSTGSGPPNSARHLASSFVLHRPPPTCTGLALAFSSACRRYATRSGDLAR